ncbi:hypothetical protein DUE52_07135 [Larkinella punicea]|uniref:Thrombospondin n=2 Tax=Larkinella punicea TaxID=2315727 RepID=A0A368JV95_9BACT|nr:hypothetical protein DUE52_07135 [Larkinella punicea]
MSLLAVMGMLVSIPPAYAQSCYAPISGTAVQVGGVISATVCAGPLCLGTGTYNELQKITDNSLETFANINTTIAAQIAQGISVKRTNGTYTGENVVGFILSRSALVDVSVQSSVTIRTYLNGNPVSAAQPLNALVSGSALGSVEKMYATFTTNQEFDEVRLNTSLLSAEVFSNLRIFAAVAFPTSCSTPVSTTACNDYISGLGTDATYYGSVTCAACSLTDRANLIDGNNANYAVLTPTAGVASEISVSVIDTKKKYKAGDRAGFVIAKNQVNALLALNALSTITIETYLFGTLQEAKSPGDPTNVVGLSLLAGSNTIPKQKLGFTTTLDFNEVRIRINSLATANVGAIRLYGAFVEATTCTNCETLLNNAGTGKYNGAIVTGFQSLGLPWTGVHGLGLHALTNSGNAVTSTPTDDFATYTSVVGVLGAGLQFTVENDGTDFTANTTFAGFHISKTGSLIALGLLDAITIKVYNGTTLVDESTSASLLGASLISGTTTRSVVGFYPDAAFDRIQLIVNEGLLSADLAGDYLIYDAFVIEDADGDGVPDCQDVCGTGTGNDLLDFDGDGIPDTCDPDDDNDGIPDTVENPEGDPNRDTDGDSSPDLRDLDSDNDGIPDSVEKGPDGNNPSNTDGTDVPDYRDPDSDNDGIPDSVEAGPNGDEPRNTDGDALPDYLDLDSDNDGILDTVEKGSDGNNPTNSDTNTGSNPDGRPDYIDLDADNDGINDVIEANPNGSPTKDSNGDGIADGTPGATGIPASAGSGLTPPDTDGDTKPDFQDIDTDGDGIPDLYESGIPNPNALDTNKDGIIDDASETDNDGIPTVNAPAAVVDGANGTYGDANSPALPNNDGDAYPNYRDLDSDNDGITDTVEKGIDGANPTNTDGDLLPDYLDLDSDNDGINDVVEATGSPTNDSNGDGIADGTPGATGIPSSAGSGVTPADADNDGSPNYRDLDSDNDSKKDLYESGIPNPASLDTNGDGVVDAADGTDNDGIPQTVDGEPNAYGDSGNPTLPNEDTDENPDYIDPAGVDLYPTLSMPDRLYGASGGAKNLKVQVYNLIPATNTNGTITLTISRPSPFYTMALSTAEALQDQWILTTETLLFKLVSKTGVTIAGSSFNEIEMVLTASGSAAPGLANLNINILAGSGGETNTANNVASAQITIE